IKVGDLGRYEVGPKGKQGVLVAEDDTPRSLPPVVGTPDALTSDVAEGPNTAEIHAGTVSGFGMRGWLVGVYGSAIAYCQAGANLPCPNSIGGNAVGSASVPALPPGDRGLIASQVPLLDVRNVGVSSSAQSMVADTLTANDIANMRNILA